MTGLLLALSLARPPAVPDSLTLAALQQALSYVALDTTALDFEKRWPEPDSFRLPLVDSLLGHPLKAPRVLARSRAFVEEHADDVSALLAFMARPIPTFGAPKAPTTPGPPEVKSLHQALETLALAVQEARQRVAEALAPLSPGERDTLLYVAYHLWADEDDSLSDTLKGQLLRELGVAVDTSWQVKEPAVLRIARKIRYGRLLEAALEVTRAVARVEPFLASLSLDTAFVDTLAGLPVQVAGRGDDLHRAVAPVFVDLGGNDRYQAPRVAAGLSAGAWPAVAVVLDLSGNDVYEPRRPAGLASGLLGIGVLYDLQGDDTYRSAFLSQGSGLFGIGVLVDRAGDDLYRAGFHSQAAATFGLGLLVDRAGDDAYLLDDWGQGFGSVWGYGLLLDTGGDDRYTAGGRFRHRPLLPHNYRSFAQGFGMGWRGHASGGIGFLADREGNDVYAAEVYAQGCSYWFSVGMLADGAGDDAYRAQEYAQGAGIHLSVGVLVDWAGNDLYYSRLGPSIGEGHDYSVGVLIDQAGNDTYSVSGGIGVGLYNSVGLFVDRAGNDVYTITEEIGLGDQKASRGQQGLGIFLDLGGTDTYPENGPFHNDAGWIRHHTGIGLDLEP